MRLKIFFFWCMESILLVGIVICIVLVDFIDFIGRLISDVSFLEKLY